MTNNQPTQSDNTDLDKGKPSEGLAKLHELSKDIYISELENRLRIVTEFAHLMKELAEDNDD